MGGFFLQQQQHPAPIVYRTMYERECQCLLFADKRGKKISMAILVFFLAPSSNQERR
jgi:hypothetical protein